MDKSHPILKRHKVTGTSFADVIDELELVVKIRKTIGHDLIEPTYSDEIARFKEKLTKIDLELTKIQTYEVPDMDLIFQGFRTLSKEYDETAKRISEHIPLLNILEQKKNCPIAKIIDEI